jgi:hypothetical protein
MTKRLGKALAVGFALLAGCSSTRYEKRGPDPVPHPNPDSYGPPIVPATTAPAYGYGHQRASSGGRVLWLHQQDDSLYLCSSLPPYQKTEARLRLPVGLQGVPNNQALVGDLGLSRNDRYAVVTYLKEMFRVAIGTDELGPMERIGAYGTIHMLVGGDGNDVFLTRRTSDYTDQSTDAPALLRYAGGVWSYREIAPHTLCCADLFDTNPSGRGLAYGYFERYDPESDQIVNTVEEQSDGSWMVRPLAFDGLSLESVRASARFMVIRAHITKTRKTSGLYFVRKTERGWSAPQVLEDGNNGYASVFAIGVTEKQVLWVRRGQKSPDGQFLPEVGNNIVSEVRVSAIGEGNVPLPATPIYSMIGEPIERIERDREGVTAIWTDIRPKSAHEGWGHELHTVDPAGAVGRYEFDCNQ